MKSITTHWYSVDDVMPPNDDSYRLVRCYNKDGTDFYMMASFDYEFNDWAFFEEKYNTIENHLTVSHWCTIEPRLFTEPFRTYQNGVQLL